MSKSEFDPFKDARKNAHIWRGENSILWYNEKLDGSFTLLTLYDFGDKKRRLFLEINDKNQRVEFKNEEVSNDLYLKLVKDIEAIEFFTSLTA